MAITKKLRFEVFKRDNFQCGYCGKCPPGVTLEVDHIDPKFKGGKNDINNLITVCFDCKKGKKNIPLSKISPKLFNNLDVLKEQESQIKEYRKFINKINRRKKKDIESVNYIYQCAYKEWTLSDNFKNVSLKRFLEELPKHEVIEAMELAINRLPQENERVITYFCGICWNKIRGVKYGNS